MSFPNSTSSANFCIYQLPENLGVRKLLAYSIRIQKNHKPEIKLGFFWVFIARFAE